MLSQLADPGAMQRSVAPRRFKPYLSTFGGDVTAAAELYLLDAELRGALIELLHFAEIGIRDAIHASLTHAYTKHWFDKADLDTRSLKTIADARSKLPKRVRQEPDRVVAAVSFGFWTELLEPGGTIKDSFGVFVKHADYEAALWHPALASTFAGLSVNREHAERLLRRLRRLRNRVAHHESIVFGIHQPGEQSAAGRLQRQTAPSALRELRQVLTHFCPEIDDWLQDCAHADELLRHPNGVRAVESAKLRLTGVDWI